MNFIVNKDQVVKKWSKILESYGVEDPTKQAWMAEYAQRHQMYEQTSYSTMNNVNGMGNVVAPTPGYSPGSFGTNGSGDMAQNLLPISMKIAAQTIGLDLVAVKPTSSPRIELLFMDFKYDNNDQHESNGERPLVFQCSTVSDNVVLTMKKFMAENGIFESVGGITGKRVYLNIETGVLSITVPEIKTNYIEFLGFSRIDGHPIFRTFNREIPFNKNTSATNPLDKKYFSFDPNDGKTTQEIMQTAQLLIVDFNANPIVAGVKGDMFKPNMNISLVSTLEDQLPGFVADWGTNNPEVTDIHGNKIINNTDSLTPKNRYDAENSYPNIIGPSIFTKSVQVGEIQIASTVKRTQMEDIKAATGMDINQKLESVLINELTQTISKQIVDRIKRLGELNRDSYTAPKSADGITSDFDFNVDKYIGATGFGPSPGGENTHSIQRKLSSKIEFASGYIAQEGRVGPAQYMVTNIRVAAIIKDNQGYTINPMKNVNLSNTGGLYHQGSIGGIQIYVDPYMRADDNRIFLGRKNSEDQPGLLFIPYLMAQSISLLSEATYAPKMLIRSRYAITEIGFFPEKQFMALTITDTNGVLI